MSLRLSNTRAGLVAAALIVAGPAGAEDAMKDMAMPAAKVGPEMPAPEARTETQAERDFARVNETMMKDMGVKPTGDTDRDFVDMMLPHHQGAVDMAKVELRYGTDPVLRKMAADIVTAQEAEIAEMNAWKATTSR